MPPSVLLNINLENSIWSDSLPEFINILHTIDIKRPISSCKSTKENSDSGRGTNAYSSIHEVESNDRSETKVTQKWPFYNLLQLTFWAYLNNRPNLIFVTYGKKMARNGCTLRFLLNKLAHFTVLNTVKQASLFNRDLRV